MASRLQTSSIAAAYLSRASTTAAVLLASAVDCAHIFPQNFNTIKVTPYLDNNI